MKRKDYLSWDAYFMGIALLSAQRSKDPGTQVGACIVGADKKILSVGYNGMPIGCSDDVMPWEREGTAPGHKIFIRLSRGTQRHSQLFGRQAPGARLYTTLFPCNECAKAIIQAGIREVVYLSDKYADSDSVLASKRMMELTGVTYRAYEPMGQHVGLDL